MDAPPSANLCLTDRPATEAERRPSCVASTPARVVVKLTTERHRCYARCVHS